MVLTNDKDKECAKKKLAAGNLRSIFLITRSSDFKKSSLYPHKTPLIMEGRDKNFRNPMPLCCEK